MAYWARRFLGPAVGALGAGTVGYLRNSFASKANAPRYARTMSRMKKGYRSKKGKQFVSARRAVRIVANNIHRPLPVKWEATFDIENSGYVAAAGAATTTYTVDLNSVYQPFNTANPIPNALATIATQMPASLTSLLNANLYQRYIVRRSTIIVQIAPQSITDSVLVAVAPLDFNSTAHQLWPTYTAAAAAPDSVERLTQSSFMNVLRKSVTPEQVMCRTLAQYTDDNLSWGTYGAKPANICLWQITYQTADQAVLTAVLVIRVNVQYQVELFQGLGDGEEKQT